MAHRRLKIVNIKGLHARASAKLVERIAAGRLAMLAAFAASAAALFAVARRVAGREAGWIAVLALLSSGHAIAHGASFRADPLAAGLLSVGVALMVLTPMRGWQMAALSLVSALAVVVTVKAGLYAPVYLAALLCRAGEPRVLTRILIAGAAALLLAAAMFLWHRAGLAVAVDAGENLRAAARVTMTEGLLPRRDDLVLWAMLSPGALMLAGWGILAARSWRLRAALLLAAGPLFAVLIYRNAFAYYFPFAAPPLMVAAALGWHRAPARLRRYCLALMLASLAFQTIRAGSEGQAVQRATLAEVHRLFPDPVPYIAQSSVVAAFPRQGPFLTTWGLAQYRATGEPDYRRIIAEARPPFVLADRAQIAAALDGTAPPGAGLLPRDAEALRAAYVHHAGPIWLAGASGRIDRSPVQVTLTVPGRYVLRAEVSLRVDGQPLAPGGVIEAGGAPLRVEGPDGADFTFVWQTAAETVPPALPQGDLYAGFWTFRPPAAP